jgi:TfoX/Sxy family transcriptional regulator of competence genes
MAYDEQLAERIRAVLADEAALTERRMFGGLAFLLGGHMAVAAIDEGGMMVRVERDHADQLVATTGARPVEMRGRPMRGWLEVAAGSLASEEELSWWVDQGRACVRALPPKG